MKWNLYSDTKPSPSSECIVAYMYRGKTMIGLFTYNDCCGSSYWKNESGLIVYCRDNHKWYYMLNIVDDVAQKIENSIREEL